jgi:hypothetical protein
MLSEADKKTNAFTRTRSFTAVTSREEIFGKKEKNYSNYSIR